MRSKLPWGYMGIQGFDTLHQKPCADGPQTKVKARHCGFGPISRCLRTISIKRNRLLEAINEYGRSNNLLVTPLLGGDVLPGTAAYLHVQFPHPVFNHRGALENLDIQVAVQKMVLRHLRRIFAQKPDIAMAWLGRSALTARRRLCGS